MAAVRSGKVIDMNSFDLMIERYKKELIDAKKRSMTEQLKEVTAQEEPLFVSAEPQEEKQTQEAVAVSASPEADVQPEKASVREVAAVAAGGSTGCRKK